MTWIVKLALVSACLYVTLVFFLDVTLLLIAKFRGAAGIYMSRPLWFAFFAGAWTFSFWLAYRISPLQK